MTFDRRSFLKGAGATGFLLNAHPDLIATAAQAAPSAPRGWDAGSVRHILPAVSDSRMLIKASFAQPLAQPPTLRVGGNSVRGTMTDSRGEFWYFYASGLGPGRSYRLALTGAGGRALCEPGSFRRSPRRTNGRHGSACSFCPAWAATRR